MDKYIEVRRESIVGRFRVQLLREIIATGSVGKAYYKRRIRVEKRLKVYEDAHARYRLWYSVDTPKEGINKILSMTEEQLAYLPLSLEEE